MCEKTTNRENTWEKGEKWWKCVLQIDMNEKRSMSKLLTFNGFKHTTYLLKNNMKFPRSLYWFHFNFFTTFFSFSLSISHLSEISKLYMHFIECRRSGIEKCLCVCCGSWHGWIVCKWNIIRCELGGKFTRTTDSGRMPKTLRWTIATHMRTTWFW